MPIDYDDLLDFVVENNLSDQQTIGTLLDLISDSEDCYGSDQDGGEEE